MRERQYARPLPEGQKSGYIKEPVLECYFSPLPRGSLPLKLRCWQIEESNIQQKDQDLVFNEERQNQKELNHQNSFDGQTSQLSLRTEHQFADRQICQAAQHEIADASPPSLQLSQLWRAFYFITNESGA